VGKCRYGLDLPGGSWVLDVFEGANAPLVVAEVELSTPDQPVIVPAWCVREVSGRHELSNAALAVRPLAAWSEAERRALLETFRDAGG
jgi:CYTH domain-containing protein